ncbi:MAG: DegV family protein [Chloroflexi bacterium]|nr:DegV family protein [Chloroflexota bacterium]
MSKAKIVTDSSAELSPDVVERLGIEVVPWRLQMGTETVQDGPSFRSPEAYRDMIRHKVLPVPIAPDARHFTVVYERLCQEADEIVSVHCSSHLNRVFQAANQARARFLGRCEVYVVDSQFISRALGLLVEAAAQAAMEGMSGADIVRLIHGMIPRVYFAFHVEKMDYLNRAGLVADERRTATGLSRVLLMMEDGQIVSFHRSRSRGTPVDRLMDFVIEFQRLEELAIVHSGLTSGYQDMAKRLEEELPTQRFTEHIYGPILFNYLGPTALGVVVFEG